MCQNRTSCAFSHIKSRSQTAGSRFSRLLAVRTKASDSEARELHPYLQVERCLILPLTGVFVMKTRWALAALAVVLLAAVPLVTNGAEEEEKASFWMKKKLAYSEQILAGLTTNDFELVAKNARSMNKLGHLEKWVRANTPQYRAQMSVFRHANEQLIGMADEENLDGAALAYVQLTLSCVNCHKIVRDSPREEPKRSP
jgi:hypothetical protein